MRNCMTRLQLNLKGTEIIGCLILFGFISQAGVGAVLAVAEHQGEFSRILQLSEQYADFVVPCFGCSSCPGIVISVSNCVTHMRIDGKCTWVFFFDLWHQGKSGNSQCS